jgi:hypothetical protein
MEKRKFYLELNAHNVIKELCAHNKGSQATELPFIVGIPTPCMVKKDLFLGSSTEIVNGSVHICTDYRLTRKQQRTSIFLLSMRDDRIHLSQVNNMGIKDVVVTGLIIVCHGES